MSLPSIPKSGAGENNSGSASRCLHIGLINNMPDAALKATERQFRSLLSSGPDGIDVNVSLFALPGVPRTESGRLHISQFYSPLERLWNTRFDGLIVTGAEPQASDLSDEPYWGEFTRMIEWAEANTHSTIWSCLAAHAAVQSIDGIRRRRLSEKRFGVFKCLRASDHELTADQPSLVTIPHSRWNDIPEDAVRDCGYTILTRLREGGVDAFVKQRKSLFVFFQGHPEYESNTLLLEYRREIGRFLKGERDTFPAMPTDYFDPDMSARIASLREQAEANGFGLGSLDYPSVLAEAGIENTWFATARKFYSRWLAYLVERKPESTKVRAQPSVVLPGPGVSVQRMTRIHASGRS